MLIVVGHCEHTNSFIDFYLALSFSIFVAII